MSDTTKNIIIKAKDETATGLTSISQNFKRMDGELKKVTKTFDVVKGSIVVGLGVTAAKEVSKFVGSCINDFAELERNNLKLKASLHGNEEAFSSLTKMIAQIASTSNISKSEIEDLVSELAVLGKSPAEIEKLTKASTILAEATGQSLNGAFTQLNATLTGTPGRLNKLIPELDGLTKEQLKSGSAVDLVIDKMGAFTKSVESSWSVKVKALGDEFGDLKQTLGQGWAEAFKPMVDEATKAVRAVIAELEKIQATKKRVKDEANVITSISKGDTKGALEIAKGMSVSELSNAFKEALAANPLATKQQQEALDAIRTLLTTRSTVGFQAPTTTTVEEKKPVQESVALAVETAFQGWNFEETLAPLIDAASQSFYDNASSSNGGTSLFEDMSPITLLMESFGQMIEPIMMIRQILDPIGLILKGFFDTIGPALTTIIRPLFDAFQSVGKILAEALFPILNAIAPIFAVLANLILSNVMPVIALLTPAIQLLATILDVVVTPIVKGFAVAMEILTSPIRYLGDLFTWVGKVIADFGWNVTHWFNQRHTAGSFKSDAFSGLGNRIADIWNQTGATVTATGPGLNTTSTSASYQAAKDITVNIYYDHSYVNGDAREISLNLIKEWKLAEGVGL